MLADLLGYSLSDFLMFAPRVYYRLFELYNRAFWPTQLLALLLGLAIIALLFRAAGTRRRIIPAILGVLWIWVAWAFLWERYATINWPIAYVVPAFILEALLLIGIGVAGRLLVFAPSGKPADMAGVALFVAALLLYPALAPLMGRGWPAAEIFGFAPDPTAVATLALLALADGWFRWLLMIIPLLWCAISSVTLWTMGASDYFVPIAGALAAIVIAIARGPVRRLLGH
jgi:hypothetical protein